MSYEYRCSDFVQWMKSEAAALRSGAMALSPMELAQVLEQLAQDEVDALSDCVHRIVRAQLLAPSKRSVKVRCNLPVDQGIAAQILEESPSLAALLDNLRPGQSWETLLGDNFPLGEFRTRSLPP